LYVHIKIVFVLTHLYFCIGTKDEAAELLPVNALLTEHLEKDIRDLQARYDAKVDVMDPSKETKETLVSIAQCINKLVSNNTVPLTKTDLEFFMQTRNCWSRDEKVLLMQKVGQQHHYAWLHLLGHKVATNNSIFNALLLPKDNNHLDHPPNIVDLFVGGEVSPWFLMSCPGIQAHFPLSQQCMEQMWTHIGWNLHHNAPHIFRVIECLKQSGPEFMRGKKQALGMLSTNSEHRLLFY
jgi:hypothetical protein